MGGLLGFALGGAMSGWGKGQIESIKARREEKLAALEMERADARDERKMKFDREMNASDQTFRAGEAAENRKFQSGETDRTIAAQAERDRLEAEEKGKDRQATIEENQKNRDAAADRDVIPGPEGTSGTVKGGVFQPLRDDKGNILKVPPKTNATSAEVQTMQFAMEHGVPFEKAYKDTVGARDKSGEEIEATFYKTLMESSKPAMAGESPEDLRARSDEARKLAKEAAGGLGTGPAAPTSATSTQRPKDMTDDTAIQKAKAAVAAGKDPVATAALLRSWGIDPSLAGL